MTKIAKSQRQEVADKCMAGIPMSEVAANYGVTWACINSILSGLGVKPPLMKRGRKTKWTVELCTAVGAMYESGKTATEVADAFGTSEQQVGVALKSIGAQLHAGVGKPGNYKRRVSVDSHAAMIEMYKSGKTLEEVGAAYSVTRERARQILAALGIGRMDGGMTMRSFGGVADRVAAARAKDARHELVARAKWGMNLADYKAHIAEYGNTQNSKSPMHKYMAQRGSAGRRGIAWNFTFADWWRVWQESGKWSQRALSKTGFVMARYGDGDTPYSVDTVYICTQSQNSKDSYIVSPAAVRFANSPNRAGSGLGYTHVRKNKANPYLAQFRGKKIGTFPTPELARAAYLLAVEAHRSAS